jgi:Domain of unknown function (DUF1824)
MSSVLFHLDFLGEHKIAQMRGLVALLQALLLLNNELCEGFLFSFNLNARPAGSNSGSHKCRQFAVSVDTVADASRILADWDRAATTNSTVSENLSSDDTNKIRSTLVKAVRTLNRQASNERSLDSTQGRCMLGICASSAAEGIVALKTWVTNLELPRGLLHGMDEDGVPLELNGSVYIKYNSGGVYTFADIRKSQMGFNALWKPGDAMLEAYDGNYRGVYFQVELSDGNFRQYLLPLDLFDSK